MRDLRGVSGIFEDDEIMAVQTDGSLFFVFPKQILNDIHHAYVSMMTPFGKQVGDSTVSLCHEVVYDDQALFISNPLTHIRKPL